MSRYIQKKFLGSGTYSSVYLAEDTVTKTLVALKKMKISVLEGIPATTLREIAIIKGLNHPNILKYLDTLLSLEECVIIFEYVEFTLFQYVNKTNRLNLINQLIKGVVYIHSNKIIHRDLKPENILVTKEGILKIADFNLARSVTFLQKEFASEVVTLWYRSPELLKGKTDYSYYIDIWSLGCIIAEILGTPVIFQGKDAANQLYLVENRKGQFLYNWLEYNLEELYSIFVL
ncbi:Cyclin-dependent kinase PHO85 [Tubulinosema ratisbonensis]|uniref:Cyclin-dependent kinase PHO85 n=1 Tax=Tubulinosema ratisbonensis TaxID=291195 RepID=A0A437AIV8_9MICR|nr:Cyclin-dependent kinase PHO85 [Tubulinosema ratisbonensis]